MKPDSLTLRGFVGIKMGMDREEVTLNLSNLSGLVAFDGPVGKGKTTVLDNLHPYRRLASREGSLQRHVYLRDSNKEFSFYHGGHHYRTLVKIDSQSGRQEGFIYKDGATKSEVSSKVTEYDEYIEDLLGSPKLFFQSAFAAQNGESIADMSEGDLKKLFTEFLPLEKLVEYEETAKQAGNAVQDQIDALRRQVKNAELQIADKAELEKQMSDKDFCLEARKAQSEKAQTKIDTVSVELEKARDAATEHRAAEERKKVLSQEKTEIEKQIKAADDTWTKYKAEVERRLKIGNKAIADKKTELQGKNRLQGMKDELQSLEKDLPAKESALEKAQKDLDQAQLEIDNQSKCLNAHITDGNKRIAKQQATIDELAGKASEIERRRNDINSRTQTLEKDDESTRLSYQIKELETTAAKKDMLPVECNADICPFIADARRAEAELPKIRDAYKKRQAQVKYELDQLRAELRQVEKDMENNRKAADQAKTRKTALTRELEEGQQTIDAQIKSATEKRTGAKKQIEKIRKEIAQVKKRQTTLRTSIENQPNYETLEAELKAYNERIDELTQGMAEKQAEHDRQIGTLKPRMSEIDSAIAALAINPAAEKLVTRKTVKLKAVRKAAKAIEDHIAKLQSEVAVLQHRLKECARVEEKIASDHKTIDELSKELSEWRYIQHACGKDGLRALEIDGTAPLIAEYANTLLTSTFGPGATVAFKTLDDDGKECLDIVVYRDIDLDDRGTLLKNLSGGQKVWILKALRLALTLVAKEKSGKDIAAALADEEDGSLDAESAVLFIGLYRAFMKTGGFEICPFITHRDVCKQMADHVIRFSDSGIKVATNNLAAMAA